MGFLLTSALASLSLSMTGLAVYEVTNPDNTSSYMEDRACCADIWSTDAWDSTGVTQVFQSCVAPGTHCLLFGFDDEARSRAAIAPYTQRDVEMMVKWLNGLYTTRTSSRLSTFVWRIAQGDFLSDPTFSCSVIGLLCMAFLTCLVLACVVYRRRELVKRAWQTLMRKCRTTSTPLPPPPAPLTEASVPLDDIYGRYYALSRIPGHIGGNAQGVNAPEVDVQEAHAQEAEAQDFPAEEYSCNSSGGDTGEHGSERGTDSSESTREGSWHRPEE